LYNLMPIAGTLAVVAALSMAGIPPLSGLLSKEMLLEVTAHPAWLNSPWVFPVIATVAATFSVAYSLRYIAHVYFGPRREQYPKKPHDPGFGLWGPPAVLVALVVAIGLFPASIVGPIVATAGGAVTGGDLPY